MGLGVRLRPVVAKDAEVTALVGLENMLQKQGSVAAAVLWLRQSSLRQAAVDLRLRQVEIESASLDVEDDRVTILHDEERPTYRRLGRHVKDDRSKCSPAHPSIGDPHHVGHATLEELRRDRDLSPFGHSGATARAGVPENEHRCLVDLERVVVDAGCDVVDILENNRPAAVPEERGRCGAELDQGAIRRERPLHHADAAPRA